MLFAGVVVALLACVGVAAATVGDDGTIHACLKPKSGDLRVIDPASGDECRRYEEAVDWNREGPAGPKGETGAHGEKGERGEKGDRGESGAPVVHRAQASVPYAGDFNDPPGPLTVLAALPEIGDVVMRCSTYTNSNRTHGYGHTVLRNTTTHDVLVENQVFEPDNSVTEGIASLGTQADGTMDAIAASERVLISLGPEGTIVQMAMINKTDASGCDFDLRWWKLA
jgi:hypothetical protein